MSNLRNTRISMGKIRSPHDCFCNLRMWEDLSKNWLTSLKLCKWGFSQLLFTSGSSLIRRLQKQSYFPYTKPCNLKVCFELGLPVMTSQYHMVSPQVPQAHKWKSLLRNRNKIRVCMGIFSDHYIGSCQGVKNSNNNLSKLLTLSSRFIYGFGHFSSIPVSSIVRVVLFVRGACGFITEDNNWKKIFKLRIERTSKIVRYSDFFIARMLDENEGKDEEHVWSALWMNVRNNKRILVGVYMTPGRLSPRSEFTPVPSHGSIFVYMIPPQNVMPARVTPAWVHPGSCTGARISLRYEISQWHHVNAKRPLVSVWNRSAGRLERVAHA